MKITPYNLHKAPLLPHQAWSPNNQSLIKDAIGAFRFIQSSEAFFSEAEGPAFRSYFRVAHDSLRTLEHMMKRAMDQEIRG